MDGTDANRRSCSKAETEPLQAVGPAGDNDSQGSPAGNDRVTLKKEIGLLSACAIIIGE